MKYEATYSLVDYPHVVMRWEFEVDEHDVEMNHGVVPSDVRYEQASLDLAYDYAAERKGEFLEITVQKISD